MVAVLAEAVRVTPQWKVLDSLTTGGSERIPGSGTTGDVHSNFFAKLAVDWLEDLAPARVALGIVVAAPGSDRARTCPPGTRPGAAARTSLATTTTTAALSLTLSLTLALTLSLTLALTLSLTLALTLALSLALTLALTLTLLGLIETLLGIAYLTLGLAPGFSGFGRGAGPIELVCRG